MKNEEQKNPISSSSMEKIKVEVCLISARGLPRSSLWKHQWYAVGWIDPKNKYCTTIDASGTSNPHWKTKFEASIDCGLPDFQNLALQIEVHSREPVFLREKLQGTASVSLREFLGKSEKGNEDVGSFQLRKIKSDKPLGFIDVSIRVSEEKEVSSSYSYLGKDEGFNLQGYPPGLVAPPFHLPGNPRPPPPLNHPYTHPPPYPPNYPNPSFTGSSHPRPIGPSYPPPPPSSNVGYIPTFIPQTNTQPTSYVNMPSSGRGVRPGFGVGLGAGALAAGAVIFGDDFMSGFTLPAVRSHVGGSNVALSTDLPF